MKIKSITLKNFRQYQDIEFDFSKTKSNNDLNYILAENGIGKTTLLNAITWCLYNSEMHITEKLKEKALPILTLDTFRKMNVQEEIDSYVSITLSDRLNEVTFKRYITFRKTEDNIPYPKTSGQKVIISRQNEPSSIYETEEEFQHEISIRLPEKIQQFFFFDGEQLDTYLAGTTGSNVEESILRISKIDLLTLMEDRLTSICRDMRGELSKKNKNSADLNQSYEAKEKYLTRINEELTDLQNQHVLTKSELSVITSELKDDDDIAEIESARAEAIKNRNETQTLLDSTVSDFKKKLLNYRIILTALPSIRKFYDFIKDKESKKELPPKYDKAALLNMITTHHCDVCDRDLDENSAKFIEDLLKRFELNSDTGILLTENVNPLEILIKQAKEYESEKLRICRSIENLKQQITEKDKKISECDLIISKYTDKEKIKKAYEKRRELEDLEKKQNESIIRTKVEVEECTKKLKELKEELDKALAVEAAHSKLGKCHELACKARDRVHIIIQNIKGDIRSKISTEMSNKFFDLMWKEKFQKVELTENYTASITNLDGLECLGSCSAAERELLVLAFTLALHKQSGFDGPLVIDTPLSRISGKLRISFAKVLRKVSETKQIILFMTEDEYSTNVKDVFETTANCKFKLKLENEDFISLEEM